jgi:drug/metabolite transporter (DMT)-like permease
MVSPLWMNAFKALVASICFLLAAFFERQLFSTSLEWISFLKLFASGFIGLALGDIFLLRSYADLGPGRTLIIFSFQPSVLAIVGHFVFGQQVSPLNALALALLMTCLMFLAAERKKVHGSYRLAAFVPALIAVSCDGVGLLLTKSALTSHGEVYGIFGSNLLRCVGALVGILFLYSMSRESFFAPFKKIKKHVFAAAFFAFLGTFVSLSVWLKAMSMEQLSTVAAIGGTGPLFTNVFEHLADRRWPSRYLYAALACFMIGFALLLSGQ